MKMIPSWVLLTIIIAGGIVVIAANSYYPLAKAAEDRDKLARDARAIVMPEVRKNLALIPTLEAILNEPGKATTLKFDVGAWETISRGNLLVGLKPEEISKLLDIYRLFYQTNEDSGRLLDATAGVLAVLGNAQQMRDVSIFRMKTALEQLKVATAEMKLD